MNDFEDKLRSLAFREPPAGLRREVLSAADAAVAPPARWTWRDWLWPSPLAWGALGSLLLGAFIFNLSSASSDSNQPPAVAIQTEPVRPTAYAFYTHGQDLAWLDPRP